MPRRSPTHRPMLVRRNILACREPLPVKRQMVAVLANQAIVGQQTRMGNATLNRLARRWAELYDATGSMCRSSCDEWCRSS